MSDLYVGTVYSVLELRDQGYSSGIDQAVRQTQRFQRQVEDATVKATDAVIKAFQSVGGAISDAGRTLSIGITAPLVAAGAAALKFSADYETAMSKVLNLSENTSEEVQALSQQVLDLAPKVGKGPQELADALLVVTSTGIHGAEALEVLTASAKAAAVGLGDTKDVARAVTSAVKAYGSENLSASRATEILFKAVKDGGAEADQFAGTLGRVVGISAQLGVSFEDVTGFIATFTRLGVDASEATTALRGTLSELLKPSAESRKALAGIGESVQTITSRIRKDGLSAALADLMEKLKGNDQALAAIFPNVRALAGILGVSGKQAEAFAQIQEHLRASTNELGEAFTRTSSTAAFKWAQLTAELRKTAIELGNALAPAMKDVLDAARPLLGVVESLVRGFGALPRPIRETATALLLVLAAVGPLLFILGSLLTAVGTVGKAIALLSGSTAMQALAGVTPEATAALGALAESGGVVGLALGALVNPVTAVIGVLGGLLLALRAMTGSWTEAALILTGLYPLVEGSRQLWKGLQETLALLKPYVDQIRSSLDDLRVIFVALKVEALAAVEPYLEKFRLTLLAVKLVLRDLGMSLVDDFVAGVKLGLEAVKQMIPGLSVVFQMIGLMTGKWDEWRKSLKETADGIRLAEMFGRALNETAAAQAKYFERNAKAIGQQGAALSALAQAQKDYDAEVARVGLPAFAEAARLHKEFGKSIEESAKAYGITTPALEHYLSLQRETAKALKETDAAKFSAEVSALGKNLQVAAKSGVPLVDMVVRYGKEADKVVTQAPAFKMAISGLPLAVAELWRTARAELEAFGKVSAVVFGQLFTDLGKIEPLMSRIAGEGFGQDKIAAAAEALKDFNAVLGVVGSTSKMNVGLLRSTFDTVEAGIEELILKGRQVPIEWQRWTADVGGALSRLDGPLKNIVSRQIQLGLMNPWGKALTETKKVITETQRWDMTLDGLSRTFSEIAQVAGGAFGGVAKAIGQIISILSLASKAGQAVKASWISLFGGLERQADGTMQHVQGALKKGNPTEITAGFLNLTGAILGVVGAIDAATASGSRFAKVMKGALAGAQAGFQVAGIWGAIFGGLAGALVGAFRKSDAERAADEIGRTWGVHIGEATAKAIEETMKTKFAGMRNNRWMAEVFNLDKIIDDVGLTADNIGSLIGQLRQAFVFLDEGAMKVADVQDILNRTFTKFAEFYTSRNALISKSLIEIIHLDEQFGTHSKEIADFVAAQADRAAQGFNKIAQNFLTMVTGFQSGSDDMKRLQEQIDALTGGTAGQGPVEAPEKVIGVEERNRPKVGGFAEEFLADVEKGLKRLDPLVQATFGAMIRGGKSVVEAIQAMAPGLEQIQKVLQASGQHADGFLGKILGWQAVIDKNKELFEVLSGVDDMLVGLNNAGALTQESFSSLTAIVTDSFKNLTMQGVSGTDAIMMMQPQLQKIWELQQDFGYAVDDATQALLDQAQAAGQVGEKHRSIEAQTLDVMKHLDAILTAIGEKFGVYLPDQAKTGVDGINDQFSRIKIPDVNIPVTVDWPEDMPGGTIPAPPGSPPHSIPMAAGGLVPRMYAGGGAVTSYLAGGGFSFTSGFGSSSGVSMFRPRGTDTVPAMLTPGEYVMPAPAVSRLGVSVLDTVKSGGSFAAPPGKYPFAVAAPGTFEPGGTMKTTGTSPSSGSQVRTGPTDGGGKMTVVININAPVGATEEWLRREVPLAVMDGLAHNAAAKDKFDRLVRKVR